MSMIDFKSSCIKLIQHLSQLTQDMLHSLLVQEPLQSRVQLISESSHYYEPPKHDAGQWQDLARHQILRRWGSRH